MIAFPTRLAAALHAFYCEHERCGELYSSVGEHVVWMTCTCGARIVKPIHARPWRRVRPIGNTLALVAMLVPSMLQYDWFVRLPEKRMVEPLDA